MPFSAASMADVLEHDVVAGLGRDVGDAGAHHAGAEHADLVDRRSGSMPSGREPPALMGCRSKKNAWIMFLATWPVTS